MKNNKTRPAQLDRLLSVILITVAIGFAGYGALAALVPPLTA